MSQETNGAKSAKPIPPGFEGATPYLIVRNAAEAIAFYQKALGAQVKMRLDMPGGQVGHAEFTVNTATIMLADEFPEMGHVSPLALSGTPVSLLIYVDDVDMSFARALAAGGKERKPVSDQFYGDRAGTFEDPFGHIWCLATHTEDVAEDELARRWAAMVATAA